MEIVWIRCPEQEKEEDEDEDDFGHEDDDNVHEGSRDD